MTVLWVVLGAAVGAPMRYLVDKSVQKRHDMGFPWGTFTVNVAACFLLGLVSGLVVSGAVPGSVQALVGTGFCGALSTYSTFSYESMRLAEQNARFHAVANVVVSVTAGLGAVTIGAALARL